MYVIRCVNLFIKAGGFTSNIREAKRCRTKAAAKRDWVYPWTIVRVEK